MAQTLININGEIRNAADVELPVTGRAFRDAWQFEGDVITVDLEKAKEIKAWQLAGEAKEDAEAAEKEAIMADLKGRPQDAQAARARRDRRRATPNFTAVANAADEAGLAALTIDDIT